MSTQNIRLERNAFGQLLLTDADGKGHAITPVRAFPIAAPTENRKSPGSHACPTWPRSPADSSKKKWPTGSSCR